MTNVEGTILTILLFAIIICPYTAESKKESNKKEYRELSTLTTVQETLLDAIVPDSIKQVPHGGSVMQMYVIPDSDVYWSAIKDMQATNDWIIANCMQCVELQRIINERKALIKKKAL